MTGRGGGDLVPDVAEEGRAPNLYRMTPLEVATGWLTGSEPGVDPPDAPPRPRAVLEDLVLEALHRPPCVVAFSGGRDSSLVLAVASHLARRRGLQAPVAASYVYPGHDEADERGWQERVVRHLGVHEWVRLPVEDRHDVLGPLATAGLARYGLLWPPMVHARADLLDVARGGTLLTGEGGDEVLGPQRVTALVGTVRRRPRPGRRVLEAVTLAAAPRPVRRAVYARDARRDGHGWLREPVRHVFSRAVGRDLADRPFHWGRAVLAVPRARAYAVGLRTMALVARDHDVEIRHPLLDGRFVAALAALGGRWGYTGRSALMRLLAGDLLPEEVLTRSSKAVFNAVAVHRHARAFAEDWAGTGVDERLVDPEALRREWLSPRPHPGSLALLQSAWLASRRAGGT